MAYKKNTWANGDVITADKMNAIEAGIEETSTMVYADVLEIEIEETGMKHCSGTFTAPGIRTPDMHAVATVQLPDGTDPETATAAISVKVMYYQGSFYVVVDSTEDFPVGTLIINVIAFEW